ncbi:hypothetical protein [Thermasporomyces composti]|nr:hypothetical protein [Thermasporomyces composti]
MTGRSDLDRLLDVWARRVRLTPAEVADIRQRILATPSPALHDRTASARSGGEEERPSPTLPAPLDPTWWQSFASQVATVIVSATRSGPFATGALTASYR